MRKILITIALFLPVFAFAQIGASYIRTPDSSLVITNNDYPDDTLYKFTKDGYILRYESNAPVDTVAWRSDAISSDSALYADTANIVKTTIWETILVDSVLSKEAAGSIEIGGGLANNVNVKSDEIIINAQAGALDLISSSSINIDGNFQITTLDNKEFSVSGDSISSEDGRIRVKTIIAGVGGFIGNLFGNKAVIDSLIVNGDTLTGATDAKTYIENESFDKLKWDTSLVNNDTITGLEFSKAVRKILYPNNYASYQPNDSTYTTASIVSGVATKIVVPTTDKYNKNWSVFDKGGSDFALRYDGVDSSRFYITFSTGMSTSASNVIFEFFLYKNGVLEPGIAGERKIGTGADVGSISVTGAFDASTNDYFEVFVLVDVTTTVTLTKLSIIIREDGEIL